MIRPVLFIVPVLLGACASTVPPDVDARFARMRGAAFRSVKTAQIVPDVGRAGWVLCQEAKSCELQITQKRVRRPVAAGAAADVATLNGVVNHALNGALNDDLNGLSQDERASPPNPPVIDASISTPPAPGPSLTDPLTVTVASFAPGRAQITDEDALEALSARIVALINSGQPLRLQVDGYTDSTGPHALNSDLARARSSAVAHWLQARLPGGLAVSANAHPQCCYIASNSNPAGRSLNRRVTVTVFHEEVSE